MNRRGFLSLMLRGTVAAAVLPPAVTYARQWRPTASGVLFVRKKIWVSLPPELCNNDLYYPPSPYFLEFTDFWKDYPS